MSHNSRPTPNHIINGENGRSSDGAATKWTKLTSPARTLRPRGTLAKCTSENLTRPTESSSQSQLDPTATMDPSSAPSSLAKAPSAPWPPSATAPRPTSPSNAPRTTPHPLASSQPPRSLGKRTNHAPSSDIHTLPPPHGKSSSSSLASTQRKHSQSCSRIPSATLSANLSIAGPPIRHRHRPIHAPHNSLFQIRCSHDGLSSF